MSMNILNDISQVYLEQVAAKPDFLDLDKDGNKKEPMKKAAKEVEPPKGRLKTDRNMFSIPKGEQEAARERLLAKARAKREKMKEEIEIDESSYSAKEARAGKDIGKPGKAFAKIAKSAAERYGSEESGKRVAGAVLAKLRKESLDPVGQEDDDIDNDGDTDSSDKYLNKRRKAIGKAIAKKSVKESSYYDPMDDDDFDHDEAEENRGVSGKNNPKGGKVLGKKKKNVKEGFSNWRQDLSEVMDDIEANKQIKEKKVNNKIKISPEMKESVEELGGQLVEMVELDEKAYRGLGVGRVERVSSGSYQAPETTGSAAKRKPKTETKPAETKKPAALPPEQGRRARKRRKGSPSYAEVKAQIDAKEKSRKPRKSKRSRLDSLLASIRNEEISIEEKMNMKKVEMGDVIKDFYKSDAPQFKGKSKEKRREMAIAAKLTAERGGRKLGEDLVTEKDEKIESKFKGARTPHLLDKFRKEHPGSRQPKKKRGGKETPEERQSRLTNTQVRRAVKYGLTKKEKGETQSRERYYSSRD